MATNVTYLLGAGASCRALPPIKSAKGLRSLVEDIDDLISRLKRYEETSVSTSGVFKSDISTRKKLVEELTFLHDNVLLYTTPDTFVKSLYLQRGKENEIEKIKRILSFYFEVKQYLPDPFRNKVQHVNLDSRYIPFFAAILENRGKGVSIPDNINIITWNYDFQMELALGAFTNASKLSDIQEFFGSTPSINDIKRPKIVHLNGLAGLYSKKKYFPFKRNLGDNEPTYIGQVFEAYQAMDDWTEMQDSLTFAWELSESNNKRINLCENVLSETQILIVIGYSFPFFNRDIDNRLMSAINKTPWPVDLYIQDPIVDNSLLESIRQRFKLTDKVKLKPYSYTDQFLLPNEL